MEFAEWLVKQARKQQLRQWKLSYLFGKEGGGYIMRDDHIEVLYLGTRDTVILTYDSLPYEKEQLKEFHKAGYVLDHPRSLKVVKKDVYILTLKSGKQCLYIETTNPYAIDIIRKQLDALAYIESGRVRYRDHSIAVNCYSLNWDVEPRKFTNIVEYSKFEEIVRLEDMD